MTKKFKRACAVALVSGTLLQFGGCFGGLFEAFIRNAPVAILTEFILDNDNSPLGAAADIFPDSP